MIELAMILGYLTVSCVCIYFSIKCKEKYEVVNGLDMNLTKKATQLTNLSFGKYFWDVSVMIWPLMFILAMIGGIIYTIISFVNWFIGILTKFVQWLMDLDWKKKKIYWIAYFVITIPYFTAIAVYFKQ